MKTLSRYIGREVLYATILIFVALLMLFAFFDLIHELGNVGKDGYPLGRALLFVRSLRNLLTSSAGELSIAQGKGRSQITHCGLDYFMTLSVLNQNR